MAFGNMLNKAKDVASNTGDVKSIINNMINDINSALPILVENGYKINELEVTLSLPPKMTLHFSMTEELTEEKETEILSKLESNKTASLLITSLAKASRLQNSIKVGNLKFAEVEVEASIPPSVTLKFS